MSEQKTQVKHSESCHYYHPDSTPCYEVPNKSKGGMRKTTLTDCRKMGLYPSVTTVLNIMAKPGLEIWKQNQILNAAATLPQIENEPVDDWCKRVIADAAEHGKQAMQKGTDIHGAIELALQEKPFDGEYAQIVANVFDALNDIGIDDLQAEKSLASPLGYAGKIDLFGRLPDGSMACIDFKTTEFKNKRKLHYPEQAMQLAAYAEMISAKNMLCEVKCFNIFIDTKTGEVKTHEWEQDEIDTAWAKFELALNYWKLDKGYDPMFSEVAA